MKQNGQSIWLLWVFLILGILIIFGCYLFLFKKRRNIELDRVFKRGRGFPGGYEILVDRENKQVRFNGEVMKDRGKVQFLIYAIGYKWLREESAIVSEVKLKDLQNAIATIDPVLWDDFYVKGNHPDRLTLSVIFNGKKVEANKLVRAEDSIGVEHLIFLGSTYFDPVVLDNPSVLDCSQCLLFPMEEKILRASFKRPSNQSGYEINTDLFPDKGKEVTVIISFW